MFIDLILLLRFDDIVQLDEAKRLLCEAVQLPLQYPAIFTGLLRHDTRPQFE
jgi:hypothetical protein